MTYILEPMAQVALSPVVKQDPRIPDEDSVDFEFDTTNLFQIDKSSGYDIVESGQRLNGRRRSPATAQFDDAAQDISLWSPDGCSAPSRTPPCPSARAWPPPPRTG